MNIRDINKIIEKSELTDNQKDPIFALIDYKVENDMQQVLSKMDIVVNKMDNIEKHLESKMDIQFRMILWVLGILGLLITVFKFVG